MSDDVRKEDNERRTYWLHKESAGFTSVFRRWKILPTYPHHRKQLANRSLDNVDILLGVSQFQQTYSPLPWPSPLKIKHGRNFSSGTLIRRRCVVYVYIRKSRDAHCTSKRQAVWNQVGRCRSIHICHSTDDLDGKPSVKGKLVDSADSETSQHTKIPAPHSALGHSRRRRLILPSASTLQYFKIDILTFLRLCLIFFGVWITCE